MNQSYRIFTDATADMSPEMTSGLPEFTLIPMEIALGDDQYTYGPGGNITVEDFYARQRQGKFGSTSQINLDTYRRFFEPCLKEGKDILYLCLTSGLSSTLQTARMCANMLLEEYPERKIICMDSFCASIGEGYLLREVLRKQAEGMDLAQLEAWVAANRDSICHWFTVDTFDHLRHGGRVSAAAAVMGTALQIKPLLHVSHEGFLEVAEKPRGQKRAMTSQLARMEKGWQKDVSTTVVIGHGDCMDRAQLLKTLVLEKFPDAQIYIAPIGPVIGAHTGPDMLALVYWGSNR